MKCSSYKLLFAFFFLAPALSPAKETARVLPEGIHRFRVVGIVTDTVGQTYNDSGDVESLSRSLNRSVTVNDLAASASGTEAQQLTALISALNGIDPGLGDQLSRSDLYSDFGTDVKIYLPAFEYGVTDRFSVGIRMPVVNRNVKNRFNVDSLNNSSAITSQLGNINPAITDGLVKFGNKEFNQSFFEKALFTDKGYEAPHDFTDSHVGDVEFGGKWNFYKTDMLVSTVLLGGRIPTGSSPSLANKFDNGTGKGAWGSAVQFLQEVEPVRNLIFEASAKGTYNFSDTRERAVPRDANDTLPSLLPKDGQVQSVKRTLGMMWESELAATYRILDGVWGVWSAYQYTGKGSDKFSGPGNLYYAGLSKNTASDLHAGEVGVEFSTIPAFRRGAFKVPLEVSLLYNTPIKGRNTPVTSYTRMDVMLYF